jgi:hypothetical protein
LLAGSACPRGVRSRIRAAMPAHLKAAITEREYGPEMGEVKVTVP